MPIWSRSALLRSSLYTSPAPFHSVPPARILDTRATHVPVGPNASIDVQAAGTGPVPPNASAVIVNVTAGFLLIKPLGMVRQPVEAARGKPDTVQHQQTDQADQRQRDQQLDQRETGTRIVLSWRRGHGGAGPSRSVATANWRRRRPSRHATSASMRYSRKGTLDRSNAPALLSGRSS